MNPTLHRREFLAMASLISLASLRPVLAASPKPLKFPTRRRVAGKKPGDWRTEESAVRWDPGQTALVICDMWDLHHCKNATERVGELAPRMNDLVSRARSAGALIIHAPSSCLAPYEGTVARKRAKEAPKAGNLPKDIANWCDRIPSEEAGKYPIDQSDGGCDTEDEPQKAWAAHLKSIGRNPGSPWLRQIDVIGIRDEDAVSDSGVEIWNLMESRGIRNVLVLGVHTNMCVLGRPFGLRQMAKNGRNVLLVRDLTDTMYNPRSWPHVDHFTGTDLIVEHIEKFVCSTTTSVALLGGRAFRFKGDKRKV
ncbi:MAG: hypothetical protein IT581_11970 [Verrucomicrobiales bacterium]|nr:hypothetical protein [Verrucomicrobiales bacterium]